ncbi:hypothetical protein GOBAR_DD14978 [Gossypium barbadense]|nr:hypothetical protein GOBAR_DD14978 [Gossypium barbadense]
MGFKIFVVAMMVGFIAAAQISLASTVPAFLWATGFSSVESKESVNYQIMSPKDLANSVLSQGGWSDLLCSERKNERPVDLAVVFVGREFTVALWTLLPSTNFSMAFPYVATSEEETMENLLVSSFKEACGHGLGVANVAFLESCSIEGGDFQKLANLHSVHDHLVSRMEKRTKGETDLVVLCHGGFQSLKELDQPFPESEILTEVMSSVEQSGAKYAALYVSDPFKSIHYPGYRELERFLADDTAKNGSASPKVCDEVCQLKSSLLEGVLVLHHKLTEFVYGIMLSSFHLLIHGAAEKRKARRSSASVQNVGRDPSSDTPPRKQAAKQDVYQLFAEKVRDHKDLESRWAVLQETRVEYFRGKDFVSFMKNHPELKEILESDRDLETEDIANNLLQKNLLVRCDRVVKTVRPGKKKLSTWPAHLEIFPERVFSENDAFFAWTFVKRRPLWQTLLSFFWPILTLAICLFPVYPHRCKLLILYSCAGLLLLILSLLLLRAAIFGAAWIVLGKRIWFFPNILAEEATLRELFRFLPKKDEEERPKWTARLFYAIVAVLVILLLRHHAPDEAARARYQKRMSNIIDDVLEWSPSLALSGMMEKQPVVNATEDNNKFSNESKVNSETVTPPDETENPDETDQHQTNNTI